MIAKLLPFLALPLLFVDAAAGQDLADLGSLKYRNIGPSRGGRATAVCGDVQNLGTFYMGATGGGVWKTEDYGRNWSNISDGFFQSPSIGAIRVATTDSDLIWVGTGSDGIRSNVIPGRGIYKSKDAGETWQFMGLENTGQIGAVEIHPTNHDIVFVAAIGNAFAPNEDRGVYRTRDGGETWQRVFRVSATCGAVDLEIHPANPDMIYASMWEAERKPWTIKSGGRQGGVWRTSDGGDSWQQLGGGLPTGTVGKSDLAVAFADPEVLWVLIEAAENPGLYRSNDHGDTFEFVSNQRGLLDRPFYYCNIDCDPSDANHLIVNATGYHESTDGGKRWRRRFTPHGDNHETWIHPEDPKLMVQCNDGGANVTTDGGDSWSTQTNQPTAELYQVAVDDRFPYWVYAGQQDNSTIRVPSRAPYSAIGGAASLWQSVGGCETGPAIPKPGDPDIVYANCKGRFGVYNHRTGQEQHYYVGAESLYGHNPRDLQYRFQRVAPISLSPHDRDAVYHGSQFLHRSRDGGKTWRTLSPDLTAFEADKQVISGSPITRDITGEEYYSTLYEIAESPVQKGVIWTGANDGPIYITRDDGDTWLNVTPDMPRGGRVQTIEPSSFDAGTAYACVLRYQLGDASAHVYKTTNYGADWRRITNGLPENCPARVLREDPSDQDILFLGTEWGMYVSQDAGQSWRPFQQNLPVTPITDMVVHRDDLVLSTMGRSFWILDDISPLRALKEVRTQASLATVLLKPRQAVRTRLRGAGATLHYRLHEAAPELELAIYDLSKGQPELIRNIKPRAGSRGDRGRRDQRMRAPFRRRGGGPSLATSKGLHRYTWDMRRDAPNGRGPMVAAGDYEVRLVTPDGTSSQRLTLKMDPRVAAEGITADDLRAQADLILAVQALSAETAELVADVRDMSKQLSSKEGQERIREIRAKLVNAPITYPQGMLQSQVRYLGSMLDRADQRPGNDAYARLKQLQAEVAAIRRELAALK
jgi:photosystem II stability/assembly factor-like uncharacterized protein